MPWPLFVITNVASPTAAHAPVTVNARGGGGGTQRLISACAVRALSSGLVNVYVLDEPFTLMTVCAPAANWNVLD